jgi:hypothetical protein
MLRASFIIAFIAVASAIKNDIKDLNASHIAVDDSVPTADRHDVEQPVWEEAFDMVNQDWSKFCIEGYTFNQLFDRYDSNQDGYLNLDEIMGIF